MLLLFTRDIFLYRHTSGAQTGNVTVIVSAGVASSQTFSGSDTMILGGIVNPQTASGTIESGVANGAVETVTASGLES